MSNQEIIRQQLTPQPVEPNVLKEQKRVELNMAKMDVKARQVDYDNLDPAEAVKRKTDAGIKEANDYISLVQTRFNYETELYNNKLLEIESLSNNPAFKIAQKYKKDISDTLLELSKENKKFKEASVTNRRRFLDANPSESIEGIAGFKSIDDRIYLLFWICFLIFVIPITYYIIRELGPKLGDSQTQSIALISIITGLCIIAHLSIRYLA